MHCDIFSEIYEHMLFTSYLNFMCLMPLRLICVFLANYVPKCQMSSGPYGPIFFYQSATVGNRFLMLQCHQKQFLFTLPD